MRESWLFGEQPIALYRRFQSYGVHISCWAKTRNTGTDGTHGRGALRSGRASLTFPTGLIPGSLACPAGSRYVGSTLSLVFDKSHLAVQDSPHHREPSDTGYGRVPAIPLPENSNNLTKMVAYFRPPEGPPAHLERRSRALKWGIRHSEFVHSTATVDRNVPFPLFQPPW